jgi:hypothetical protein
VNIEYNILYFNFKQYNIPKNSKIINIVLQTTTLYNDHDNAPYELFRNYCGSILASMFHTDLTVGYNSSTFNN